MALVSLVTTPLSLAGFVLQLARFVRANGWAGSLANPGWVVTQAIAFAILAGLSLYAVAIIPNFLKRKRRTPKMMQVYWGANLAVVLVVVAMTQLAQPGAPLGEQNVISAGLSIVWLVYFRTSSDVVGTFVNE